MISEDLPRLTLFEHIEKRDTIIYKGQIYRFSDEESMGAANRYGNFPILLDGSVDNFNESWYKKNFSNITSKIKIDKNFNDRVLTFVVNKLLPEFGISVGHLHEIESERTNYTANDFIKDSRINENILVAKGHVFYLDEDRNAKNYFPINGKLVPHYETTLIKFEENHSKKLIEELSKIKTAVEKSEEQETLIKGLFKDFERGKEWPEKEFGIRRNENGYTVYAKVPSFGKKYYDLTDPETKKKYRFPQCTLAMDIDENLLQEFNENKDEFFRTYDGGLSKIYIVELYKHPGLCYSGSGAKSHHPACAPGAIADIKKATLDYRYGLEKVIKFLFRDINNTLTTSPDYNMRIPRSRLSDPMYNPPHGRRLLPNGIIEVIMK